MALPASLRASVIPAELELIASEQLVEIIPLVAMERTAFISVLTFLCSVSAIYSDNVNAGCLWTSATTSKVQGPYLDGY